MSAPRKYPLELMQRGAFFGRDQQRRAGASWAMGAVTRFGG